MDQPTGLRPQVLIVGAGPIGLALSIELGLRGIRCLVVERNDRVGLNPRAKTTNARTREHLRRWGIADALRQASSLPADYPSAIIFATRMNGYPLARFDNAFNCNPAPNDLYSESAQWVPQYTLEEVLRRRASGIDGVEIRFQTRLESAAQDDDSVTATLVDTVTGEQRVVVADYMVGADGGRSRVREIIDGTMSGQSGIARNFNVTFRAPDLASKHKLGPAIHYWLVNDDVSSVMGPMDGNGLWYFIATKIADADPSTIDAKDLIRRAVGFDFDMEILSTDFWVAHRLIADRYSSRRIYLAGDACHLHPPFGGFGLNMGVGDAVDLGWKLAATLQGWGGEGLLASYEIERRPVHERVLREATINYSTVGNQLVRPGLEDASATGAATRLEVGELIAATKQREFKTLGVVLGYRYIDSPIIVDDGSEAPQEHFMLYEPSAHPGCLAPHLWLGDGSSLYDHFGEGLTLLVTDAGALKEAELFALAAKQNDIPVKVTAPADERLRQRYQARFAVIRPDQHVAWRGDALPANAAEFFDRVTGHNPVSSQKGSTADIAAE